jgi:streptogramin lyase
MRAAKLTFIVSFFACFFVVRICVAQTPQWVTFPYNDFPYQRYCLTFDGSGTLWAANQPSQGVGVSRFDGALWHNFAKADGLVYDTVNAMTRDRQGRIWTAGKLGVCYFDPETGWHALAVQDSFTPVREYLSIVCDSSGNIWTSSRSLVIHIPGNIPDYWAYSEIHRWDGHNWSTYDFTPEDFSHAGIETWSMTVSPNGTVWGVGAQLHDSTNHFVGGLRSFDGNKWSRYSLGGVARVRFYQPSVVECDKENNVWIGYQSYLGLRALDKFDGTAWDSDTTWPFVSSHIRSMKFDPNWRLWLGGKLASDFKGTIADFGVMEYNVKALSPLVGYSDSNSALLGSTIYSVAFDRAGNAWFSSPEGLSELKYASNVSVQGVIAEKSSLNAYPNPASTSTTLDYSFSNNAKARLTIYDILGREVHTELIEPNSGTSKQHLVLNTSGLPSGHYFFSLTSGGQSLMRELVIER